MVDNIYKNILYKYIQSNLGSGLIQPIWKILYSQFENLPQIFGVNMNKNWVATTQSVDGNQKSGKHHQLG